MQENNIFTELGLDDEKPETKKEEVSQEMIDAWYSPEWDDLRGMLTSMGLNQDAQIAHFGRNGKNVAQILVDNEKLKLQELRFKKKEIDYDASTRHHFRMIELEKRNADKFAELRYRRALESGKLDSSIDLEFRSSVALDNPAAELEMLRKENTKLKVQQRLTSKRQEDIQDV